MARLIHLNGPSRIGKSTLARRYVDEHPGVLNLDLDVIVGLVGGWRDDFARAFALARGHGATIATEHLASGQDVVMPQLVTSYDGAPWVEHIAKRAHATYLEIVLLAETTTHRARLRRKTPLTDVERQIQAALSRPDDDLLDRIDAHLTDYLADRPDAIRIDTTSLDTDSTYGRLLSLLNETG